jgi:aspartate kinase
VPDRPGFAAAVFRAIAEADVFVDMIVQNVSMDGNTHLSFTVPRHEAERAAKAAAEVGLGSVAVESAIAKLSVLGVGMKTHTGVAARMFGALADGGINIALINTSEVRINVATGHNRGQEALEYLRKAFELPAES